MLGNEILQAGFLKGNHFLSRWLATVPAGLGRQIEVRLIPLELQREEMSRPSLIPNTPSRSICQQRQMGFICQVPDRRPAGAGSKQKEEVCCPLNLHSTSSFFVFFHLRDVEVMMLPAEGPAGELSVAWRGLLDSEENLCQGL